MTQRVSDAELNRLLDLSANPTLTKDTFSALLDLRTERAESKAKDAEIARLTRERDDAIQRQKLAEQALGIEMRGRTALVQSIHDASRASQPWLTSVEIVELVAAWDHQAWAGWTAWMLDRLTPENIARWRRQIATAYADLDEGEKESDRREAREVLAIIAKAVEAGP